MTDLRLENGGGARLSNVHSLMSCAGHHCSIHFRSDHAMRSFPQHWRADRCIMERTCPHGVGHDDPDDLSARERLGREHSGIHGCDGCCGWAETLLAEGMPITEIYGYISQKYKEERDEQRNATIFERFGDLAEDCDAVQS